MGIIRVLDDHIANQIAAGEVVERPSSVVKELVENAIDAGSTRIDVTVEEGGLQFIRIADNGSGIAKDDLETAFQRHATSKIASGKDLFHIRTLGFRGEALPSIAAVAKVECVTANDDSGLGSRLVMEGGGVKALEDAAAVKGTDIRVKELFYNTPARLKYMKTIQTELGHISDYMYRLALAHPEISISLKHNGSLLLQTLGNGDLLQVIAGVYGSSLAKGMIAVDTESPDYRVLGYISKPELTRSNRYGITTIINGRYIRNFQLVQALLKAYHTLLPINRYPLAVLNVEMDPTLIDVNVHPSKLEVRFSKEQELLELLEKKVKDALSRQVHIPHGGRTPSNRQAVVQEQLELYRPGGNPAHSSGTSGAGASAGAGAGVGGQAGLAPYGRPEAAPAPAGPGPGGDARRETAAGSEPAVARPPAAEAAPHRDAGGAGGDDAGGIGGGSGLPLPPIPPMPTAELSAAALREQRSAYAGTPAPRAAAPDTGSRPAAAARTQPNAGAAVPPGAAARLLESLQPEQADSQPRLPAFPRLDPIGQLLGTYIVAQNEEGLFLIDQHAAHERINYEYYYEQFGKPQEASQELLVPITLEFTPSDAELLKSRLHYLEHAGVYMEAFGGSTFLVRAYPHWFPQGEEKEIVEEMAEWVLAEKKSIDLSRLREKSSTLCSCKASIKANQSLTKVEMEALLDRLAACRIPYTCPHGRPIVVSFSVYDLEKMFKRVM